jgi:hypothetical protein
MKLRAAAFLAAFFGLLSPLSADPAPAPAAATLPLAASADGLALRAILKDYTGSQAKKSILGDTALWTEVVAQKPVSVTAFENLEADIKNSDMDGQLRNAGMRVMDPKKKSFAMSLRPTLQLSILYAPKGTEGNSQDYYLVIAEASQDLTPLGGSQVTLPTWVKLGEPITGSGDASKDVAAIRVSARALVMAFIDVVQDNDGK